MGSGTDSASAEAMAVGFIGLGSIGRPIALTMARKGLRVGVLGHRRRQPVLDLLQAGAWEAESVGELAREVDIACLALPSTEIVRHVVMGADGLGAHMRSGSVVIDMGLTDPLVTAEIARELEGQRGCYFLDAPVTKGPKGASEGELSIMVGGNREAFERCRPVLDAVASDLFYVGPSGAGQSLKLVNNLLLFVNLMSIVEAVQLAMKLGIDLEVLFGVISASSGNSWMFQAQAPNIRRGDFTKVFQRPSIHDTLQLITGVGSRAGAPLFLAHVAQAVFQSGRLGLSPEALARERHVDG